MTLLFDVLSRKELDLGQVRERNKEGGEITLKTKKVVKVRIGKGSCGICD